MAETFAQMMKRLRESEARRKADGQTAQPDTELNLDAPAVDTGVVTEPTVAHPAATTDPLVAGDAVAPAPATPVAAPAPVDPSTYPQYKGNDIDQARWNHIANNIRYSLSDQYDLSKATDEQVIKGHYEMFGKGMDPAAYSKKLKDVFGIDFNPTLGQRAEPTVKFLGGAAESFAPYLTAELPKVAAKVLPGALAKGAGAVAKGIAGPVTQGAFVGGHLANMAVDQAFIAAEKSKIAALGGPNVEGRTEEYYNALLPGLSAQGFTPDQIHAEAHARAMNVEVGRQSTADSLQHDLDTMQRSQLLEPAKAVTDALFLGFGEGPLAKVMERVGLVPKALTEAEIAAGKVAPTLGPILSTARHAATAAVIGGVSMGAGGATRGLLEGMAGQKAPAEIAQDMVKDAVDEGKGGVGGGAVLGGALGALGAAGEAIGGVRAKAAGVKAASDVQAQIEATRPARVAEIEKRVAGEERSKLQATVAENKRSAAVYNTGQSFNPKVTNVPLDGDPVQTAYAIVSEQHGDTAARSTQGMNAINTIAEKIRLHQAAETDMTAFSARALPAGTPAASPGLTEGLAPEPVNPMERPMLGHPGAVAGTGQVPESAPTMPVRPLEPNQRMAPASEPNAPALRTQMNELQPPPTPPAEGGGPATEPAPRLPEPPPAVAPGTDQLSEAWRKEFGVTAKKPRAPKAAPAPEGAQSPKAEVPAPMAAGAEAAPPTPVPVPAKAEAPSAPTTRESVQPASQAAAALSKIDTAGHAKVVEKDGALHVERLGLEGGAKAEKGAVGAALDHIIAVADEHGVPVTMRLTKIDSNGGKIPIEKQMKAVLEPRGFQITDSKKLPEGQMATADVRREPIGTHQVSVAERLNQVARAAEKRIISRRVSKAVEGPEMHSGLNPDLANIKDHALMLAADMFSKGLRDVDAIKAHAVAKWGESIKPILDKVVDLAQKHFVRMFKETGTAEAKLSTLLELKDSGKYGMDWYEKAADWSKEKFGKDSDMFLRFLAITSANGQTESGASLALKAFAQWKAGMPFEGFRGPSMRGQMEAAMNGSPLPENTKIKNFLDALRGDKSAVVLDRWMMDALNMKDSGGSLTPDKYRIYEEVVRQLARDNEMSPRQFQAAVWEGARVRNAHVKEAAGGRAASSKIGSARPLEDLVDRKLGGLSIDEYVKQLAGNLKPMQNLYEGLAPVRKGIEKDKATGVFRETPGATPDQVGHTFDPETFAPAKHEGHVVSMVSHNTKRTQLYPGRILKFREQVKPLIADLEKKGLKPTIGVFRHTDSADNPTGEFSIDLNIMVPDEAKALEIGRLNRQFAIAKLGPGGEREKNIETGHTGKQFLPPHDYREQPAWYKQQANRIRAFLKKVGL